MIKEKIKQLIKKLINILIIAMQAYIYFSMYIIRSMFFGTGIVEIIDKQNNELRKLYETLIARKLRLGAKFLRRILYTRRNTIEIRLVQPKTMIVMSILKQYIGNCRMMNRVFSMIKISKEWLITESRYTESPIKIKTNN